MTFTEIFKTLQAIDCTEHIEKKAEGHKATFLSWPWAWGYVASRYDATYEVLTDELTKLPYFEAPGLGYICRTRVTIEGHTREMWLPVMSDDFRALQADPFEVQRKRKDGTYYKVTIPAADMFDINKTIMRCLVKNIAMFGLGLSLYAGEDLPLDFDEDASEVVTRPVRKSVQKAAKTAKAPVAEPTPAAPADLPPAPGDPELAGTVLDDQLAVALDDLRRVTCRRELVEVWHQWANIYYTKGTAESAKFIQEMDAKLAAYPRTSANSDK